MKNTHKQKIYDFMSYYPESTFMVSDFQKEPCFIWYKASARINELVHEWKLKVVGKQWRFALYQAVPECCQPQPKEHNRFLAFIERYFS